VDDSLSELDLALARLGDEVTRLLAAGETPDPAGLACRFGVNPKEAEAFVAALEAIHHALDEDLPVPSDLPPPVLPSDFELLGELGRGGMGVVYKVRQKSLDRVVALKVLRPAELVFGEAIRRFQAEARSLARLRHRHIVSIHEVGESGGNVYYTMDLIEGSSLAELISQGKVTPTRAVRILRQVAGAITYAHSQGLIHRDLKPANILVDPAGDAYVVDFGLARDLGVRGDLTATGHILGTPAYMSPEQARGDSGRIGEPTDLYALGAVLYECLSGQPPFAGMALADLIHAVIHQDPAPPSRLAPRTPADLEVICLKAMEKDPRRRYPTVRAFLEDLERFEAGRPILARPPTLLYRMSRFVRRQRVALGSSVAAAGLLAILLLAFVLPKVGQTPETILATADDLHREGQHSAAAFLCLRALKEKPGPEMERRLRLLWMRCQLGMIRELEAQGRWEEAKTLCENARQGTDEKDQVELLWELAQCQAKTNGQEAATETLHELQRLLEQKVMERAQETSESVDQEKETIDLMLDRMAPALLDPSRPGHDAAGLLFSGLLAEWKFRKLDAARWLDAQGSRRPQIFVALLPFLNRELFGTDGSDFYSMVGRVEGSEMDAALAKAVRDAALPTTARRFAADLLSARQDLPFWFGHWNVERLPPDNLPQIEAAGAFWEEIRTLPPREQFRKKVERSLQIERELGTSKDDRGWFREWMMEHTGYVLPRGKTDHELELYERWWAEHRTEDPRQWLSRALALPSPPPADQVLDLYLHTPTPEDIDRRNWLHQLLAVSAPDSVRPPLLRRLGRGEPAERAMDWVRALGRVEPPHQLRLARVVFFDGRPEPEVDWQEVHPLRIGDPVKTLTHERTTIFKYAAWTLVLPGLEPATDQRLSWARERYSTTATLQWTGTGLQLAIAGNERGFDGMVFSAEGRSYSEGSPRRRLETKVTLAVSESAASNAGDWSLEDWKRKILEDLDFLVQGLRDAPGDRRRFVSRYQHALRESSTLTSFFRIPEAAARLIEIDRILAGDKDLSFHKDAHRSAARLLAGDPTVLADAELMGPLLKALREPFLGSQYLSRLLLSATDPAIRAFALAQLEFQKIPLEILVTFDDAIRTGIVAAPPALAAKARNAAAQVEEQQGRPLRRAQLILAGAAAIGAVLLLRLLWPGRPLSGRCRTAAWVLLLGLTIAVIRIDVDGIDYLPDSVGFGLAAVAAAVFAGAAQARLRYLPAAGFLVAGIVSALSALPGLAAFLRPIGTLGAAGAIISLPLLTRALDRSWTTAPKHRRWRLMVTVLPVYAASALLYQLTSFGDLPIRLWIAYRQLIPLFSWIILGAILVAVSILRSAALDCAARRTKAPAA